MEHNEEFNFWKTESGKIMSHGVHEHNSGMGYIINAVSFISEEFDSGKLTKESLDKYLDIILKGKIKSQDGMDYIYEKLAEIEKTKHKGN